MAKFKVRLTFPSADVVWKAQEPYELLRADGGHAAQGSPFVVTPTVEAASPEDAVLQYERLVRAHWPDDEVGVSLETKRYRFRIEGAVPAGPHPGAMSTVAALGTDVYLVNSAQWLPGSDGSAWAELDAMDESEARRRADEVASRLPGWTVTAVEAVD